MTKKTIGLTERGMLLPSDINDGRRRKYLIGAAELLSSPDG